MFLRNWRVMAAGAVCAALVACVAWLRWDAAQDAKRALEAASERAQKETLQRIIDAQNDPRLSGDDIDSLLRDLSQ